MLPHYTFTPSKDLHQFQSSDSRERYLCTNAYVLVQIRRDTSSGVEQYLNFYIRPMNENKYAIILYIPELVVMESLLEKRIDLVTLMNYSSVKDLFHASSKGKKSNTPFIAKIKDFTEQAKGDDLWVIENIIDAPFSKKIFIENSPDYNILDNGIVETQNAAEAFYEALTEYYNNLRHISWVKNYNTQLLLKAIPIFESKNAFPPFVNKLSNLKSSKLRDSLIKHGIVFQSDSETIYPIGHELFSEDYDTEGYYFIKLDVFTDSPTIKDYFIYIHLINKFDNISSFTPSIYFGEINSVISNMLNNVDNVKFAKFDLSALKLMPTTSKIWFYTNPYHEGLSLSRFIEDGDTTDYDFLADETFIKRDGEYLTFSYIAGFTVSPSNLWGKMDLILNLTQSGLIVMLEFLGYIPYYKKQIYAKVIGHLIDGATFWLNPVKKIIKWLS